jgi:hypothetical protein
MRQQMTLDKVTRVPTSPERQRLGVKLSYAEARVMAANVIRQHRRDKSATLLTGNPDLYRTWKDEGSVHMGTIRRLADAGYLASETQGELTYWYFTEKGQEVRQAYFVLTPTTART